LIYPGLLEDLAPFAKKFKLDMPRPLDV